MVSLRWLVVLLTVSACSPAPQPVGAADHLMIASDEEREAARHRAKYEAEAASARGRTAPGSFEATACANGNEAGRSPICWSDTPGPEADQLYAAERHERSAAQHRSTAVALIAAETESCRGVAPADRDAGPLSHPADVERVDPLLDGKTLRGASIVFRRVDGLTVSRMQRIVDCHVARTASLGPGTEHAASCPLAVNGARAEVTTMGASLAVLVRARDPSAAESILVRARGILEAARRVEQPR